MYISTTIKARGEQERSHTKPESFLANGSHVLGLTWTWMDGLPRSIAGREDEKRTCSQEDQTRARERECRVTQLYFINTKRPAGPRPSRGDEKQRPREHKALFSAASASHESLAHRNTAASVYVDLS